MISSQEAVIIKKQRMNKKMNSKGAMALSQIFLLIIGIVAISYAVGSEARIVSAEGGCTGTTTDRLPSIEGENIVFCYYHTDYTESKKFTVVGDLRIKSSDGTTYQKYDEVWAYTTSSGAVGQVSSSNRGDWIILANKAIEEYKTAQKSASTSNWDHCIRYRYPGTPEASWIYGKYKGNSRDLPPGTTSAGKLVTYYKDTKGNNHIAIVTSEGWKIWNGNEWLLLGKEEETVKARFKGDNENCDASRFPEEKEITDAGDKSNEVNPSSLDLPASLKSYFAARGWQFTASKSEEATIFMIDTVKIGPPNGVRAEWKRAKENEDGNWVCVNNCKITAIMIGNKKPEELCPPDGDCTGESRNLCTHYARDEYLLKPGFTDPKGHCNTNNIFVLDDSDGDRVLDVNDAYPYDPTLWEEKEDQTECSKTCVSVKGYKAGTCDANCGDGTSIGQGYGCSSNKKCCCSGLDQNIIDLQKKYKNFDDCIEAKETTREECEKAFPSTGAPFDLDKTFLGNWGYLVGNIAEGVGWAYVVYNGVKLVAGWLGGDEGLANAIAESLAVGVVAGKTAIGIVQAIEGGTASKAALGWAGIGAGLFFALATFRYETQEAIVFECKAWQADTGGNRCNDCNNQGILPCSEYQCRSLGQSCEIINKGTDKEQCAWINKNDVNFPIIEPWEEALINNDYVYNLQTTGISPPDRGVTIEYRPTGNTAPWCVKPFTPLSFGIKLDEPAMCKLDVVRKDSFDDMSFSFSGGLSLKEHSYTLSLPGAEGDGIEIGAKDDYSIYVRCQDSNGNSNPANFVFNFCVQQGPDTTPPEIVTTYPLNKMPFAYERESINMEAYINEPVSGCRWSHLDQAYSSMEGIMDCTNGNGLDDMNAQGLYTCATELNGLNDRVENKFYFRCTDLVGNVNEESYVYILQGTEPLVIDWVKPEEGSVIKGSTDAVKVTLEARTSVGYKEGESNCYYLITNLMDEYELFYSDGDYNNYEHSQDLWLAEGNYETSIKCVDLGGNEDVETVSFSVESDGVAPIVVRAYHEEIYLKLITNEPARCAYDTKYESYPCDFNFDDGTPMTTIEDSNHYTDWNTETIFYVKCQDEFGNQPWPDGCSIIVKPSDLY